MSKLTSANDSDYIFGALLIAANKMDTLLERSLKKYQVTAKQWFLLLLVINLAESPTIKGAAAELGTSHQNVKQVALKLEQKGMLRLEKDQRDRRAIRLVATEKSVEFWKATKDDGDAFMREFYADIDHGQMVAARSFLSAIMQNLSRMEEI